MRVIVSGSSGFVGGHVVRGLSASGHEAVRLVRRVAGGGPGTALWDPDGGGLEASTLRGAGAVIHLGGESIMGRWSQAKRRRIVDSRLKSTELLARTMAGSSAGPGVLLCASAIGIYGDRGDETLDEGGAVADGFLAELCKRWEAACEPARAAGVRVVNLRIGVVLGPDGGALGGMIPAFRLGLGGRLGSGRQWWSWIAIDDLVAAVLFAMTHDAVNGPINLTAPGAVTNAEFTRTLARVLRRPALLPVPTFALRLAIGQAADFALWSQRVVPRRLLDHGFIFKHPELETALRHLLDRPRP